MEIGFYYFMHENYKLNLFYNDCVRGRVDPLRSTLNPIEKDWAQGELRIDQVINEILKYVT